MIVYTEKNKKQDYFFAENTLVLYIKRCEKNNFFLWNSYSYNKE